MKIPFFGKKKPQPDRSALTECLSALLRNAIVSEHEETDCEPPLGTSKMGGKPHLPAGFVFPYCDGADWEGNREHHPLSFVAQFNLAEVAEFDRDGLLPKQGCLYFFYDIIAQPWGFDPADADGARVYYYDVPAADLAETDLPEDLPDEARVPLGRLTFRTKTELPSYEEIFDLTDTDRFGEDFDWDVYAEAVRTLVHSADEDEDDDDDDDDDLEADCKLLGYADVIQNSMLEEIAMVTAGTYCGNADAYRNRTEDQKQADMEAAREWILLAQFGTLSDEIMFGDCGCIYFYIRKEDLAARRFDKVWLCLQCG